MFLNLINLHFSIHNVMGVYSCFRVNQEVLVQLVPQEY